MNSTLKKLRNPSQSPQSKGWSPERRAKHAAAIRNWAPWGKSTGPRTRAGKARSATNSFKHGKRGARMRTFQTILSLQNRFLRLTRLYGALAQQEKGSNTSNELLKPLRQYLAQEGQNVTFNLTLALKIMQKTCFFPPPGANS